MTQHLQERTVAYVDLLNADIAEIQQVLHQVGELAQTNDPKQVHMITEQLIQTHLQTDWVVVPRQYRVVDWYMLAFDRFLSFASLPAYDILTPAEREQLTFVPTELDVPATFEFQTNVDANGGAYFVELGTDAKLFYWSLERKQILFNADALTDLLVQNFRKRTTAPRIRTLTILMTEFARYMERQFGYTVDYNILETRDAFLYPLVQNEMPAGLLDRLFVLSADSNYFLQTIQNGAGMQLAQGVEIRIFYQEDVTAVGGQRWHFQVVDGQDAVSWLDVLLDYDFIGAWYLNERRVLAVETNPLVFGFDQTGKLQKPISVAVATPKVEILQPRNLITE